MSVTDEQLVSWCRVLLGDDPPGGKLSLEQYLAGIPRLDSLAEVPSGTVVLVRGDVDAKPGKQIGEGDVRLRSMVDTLRFGQQRGWVQVILGHIGRKPEGTLKAVAARLGELLQQEVPLVGDWLDEATMSLAPAAVDRVRSAAPGSVLVLENTRRYGVERVLWKAEPADLPGLVPSLAKLANALASRLGDVYVNEALSAGSLDSSSTVVPAAMRRVALGHYVAQEFDGPMRRCLEASLVVFSGLKTDKLDDLEAMIARGRVKHVISAGSLAMALKKAAARLDGTTFCAGLAEDPAHQDKPYYLAPDRIDQAERMVRAGRANGVEFVLPVDFILADGQAAEVIGPADQQFDIGPRTQLHFAAAVDRFINDHRAALSAGKPPLAMFHNGVFGMFEDPRFESGTRHFVGQLHRMTEAGIGVYVGGGEGGTALERYGQSDWVTHCFTAGGTVLNALGAQPVPYLQALWLAARR